MCMIYIYLYSSASLEFFPVHFETGDLQYISISANMGSLRNNIRLEIGNLNDDIDNLQYELRSLRREAARSRFNNRREVTGIQKPKEITSSSNISGSLRREIRRLNSLDRDSLLYVNFSNISSDKTLNREAKRKLGVLLKMHLPNVYGKLTWAETMKKDAETITATEKVINEAAKLESFAVFSQTSDYWAIRLLADAKMRTAKRDLKQFEISNNSAAACERNALRHRDVDNVSRENELQSNLNSALARDTSPRTLLTTPNVRIASIPANTFIPISFNAGNDPDGTQTGAFQPTSSPPNQIVGSPNFVTQGECVNPAPSPTEDNRVVISEEDNETRVIGSFNRVNSRLRFSARRGVSQGFNTSIQSPVIRKTGLRRTRHR